MADNSAPQFAYRAKSHYTKRYVRWRFITVLRKLHQWSTSLPRKNWQKGQHFQPYIGQRIWKTPSNVAHRLSANQTAKDMFYRWRRNIISAYVTVVTSETVWHFHLFSKDSHVGTNKFKHIKLTTKTGRPEFYSDVHCNIKESLLFKDLKPSLNENVGSEKLFLFSYFPADFNRFVYYQFFSK